MLLRVGDVSPTLTQGRPPRRGPLFPVTPALVHLLVNVAPKRDPTALLLGHPSRPREQHGGAQPTAPRGRRRPAARSARTVPRATRWAVLPPLGTGPSRRASPGLTGQERPRGAATAWARVPRSPPVRAGRGSMGPPSSRRRRVFSREGTPRAGVPGPVLGGRLHGDGPGDGTPCPEGPERGQPRESCGSTRDRTATAWRRRGRGGRGRSVCVGPGQGRRGPNHTLHFLSPSPSCLPAASWVRGLAGSPLTDPPGCTGGHAPALSRVGVGSPGFEKHVR